MSAQDPTEEEAPPRKRGGQPGNRNARTHGFYSAALTPEEQQSLRKAIDLKGLHPEIALLRVKLMEIIASGNTDPDIMIQAVRTLTRMVDVQDRITYGR